MKKCWMAADFFRARRIAGVLLVFALLIAVFAGCSPKETVPGIDDAGAQAVLTELLPGATELNQIFFGTGLPVEEYELLDSVKGAQYFAVREESPYQSIEEIKAAAEKVFSAGYLADIYARAFGEYTTESTAPETTKIYGDDNLDEAEREEGQRDPITADDLGLNQIAARYRMYQGKLHCDMTFRVLQFDTVIDPASAHVLRGDENRVVCEVSCRFTEYDEEGNPQPKQTSMTVSLAKQGEVWLIDSPTY